jgi:hypothetical protein
MPPWPSGRPLHTSGLPRCLRRFGNNAAGGLGADLRILDHDGDSRGTVPGDQCRRIGRIARPVGPRCGDHLPVIRAGAAWVRGLVHFAFGHDRFRLRASDLHCREPSVQVVWSAQRPRRYPLPALASHWAAGSGQLGDLCHRGGSPGPVVRLRRARPEPLRR